MARGKQNRNVHKIYDDLPVIIFSFYEQEWEDYGLCGNVDGGPIATGTYYSLDVNANAPLAFGEILKPFIQDKEARKKAAEAVMEFLLDNSVTVSDYDEADAFFEGEL